MSPPPTFGTLLAAHRVYRNPAATDGSEGRVLITRQQVKVEATLYRVPAYFYEAFGIQASYQATGSPTCLWQTSMRVFA